MPLSKYAPPPPEWIIALMSATNAPLPLTFETSRERSTHRTRTYAVIARVREERERYLKKLNRIQAERMKNGGAAGETNLIEYEHTKTEYERYRAFYDRMQYLTTKMHDDEAGYHLIIYDKNDREHNTGVARMEDATEAHIRNNFAIFQYDEPMRQLLPELFAKIEKEIKEGKLPLMYQGKPVE